MQSFGIIGGGIVGSTAAYYLARNNQNVTLYDDGTGQATKASAGIICPWFTLRRNKPWYHLVSNGAEMYRQLMNDLQVDGYDTTNLFDQCGTIIPRKNQQSLDRDLEQGAIKRETAPAIQQIKTLSKEEITQYFPLIESDYPATWVEGGGRVDGAKLIETLHHAIKQHGGTIHYERASLSKQQDHVFVETTSHKQSYDKLLLSVGAWLPHILQPLGYTVDIRPQKGQLFNVTQEEWQHNQWPVLMPPGKVDIIPFADGRVVIGATHEDDMDYDLSIDYDKLHELSDLASDWMPTLDQYEIQGIKVGIRAYTPDSSVLVGKVPQLDNVWAVSGLGSSGLTSGPYLGSQWATLMLTDQWALREEDYPVDTYIHPIS